ncbi:MAG TPA: Loki-CTERM sorting domain-containing protein [Candidatus Lokiarchaeia archaeon]|nr:Loki-CTERM sorting domain-containing protein [Candidatus Lokiarchaeia archaeon]
MTSKRTRLLMGLSATILLAIIGTSMATAISPQQVGFKRSFFWQQGQWLSYGFEFYNQFKPGDNDSGKSKYYLPSVVINANFTYNITGVNGNKINLTETISNIAITYNSVINNSRKPFIAEYNSSVKMDTYLLDFENEVGANRALNATMFSIATHGSHNVTISTNASTLPDITNYVVFYMNNNTAVPQKGHPEVINRFIVSSNIAGPVSKFPPELNEGSPTTMKVLRSGMMYTPLAFAMLGQNGSIWMDQALNESAINDFGLWANSTLASGSQSMGFNDNETYSAFITGQNARWVGKYSIGYPKVGGFEQGFYDSKTGILLSYSTRQTRWDGYVGNVYYSNIQPQEISITLNTASSDIASELIQSNATTGIPGYPVVALLVALGIGVILITRRKPKD